MTTVKVIDEWAAKEDAYSEGYERFSRFDGEETEDFDFAPFTDSAEWANHILPRLRATAGYDDVENDEQTRTGTYQIENQIVLVEEPDDEPAVGELTDGHFFFEDLVDCYRSGAYDAATGRERGHSLE